MKSSSIALAFAGLAGSAIAAPAPAPQVTPAPSVAEIQERQLLGGLLSTVLGGINSAVDNKNTAALTSQLNKVTPTATPTDVAQASAALSSIVNQASPSNLFEYQALLVGNGLVTDDVASLLGGVLGQFTGANSLANVNPNPKTSVYPKKGSCDAPYSLSEAALRAAIHIPSTFTYGQKPPVILFPGTGNTGYQTFAGNQIKLLTGVDYADPVWINIPGQLLNDAQQNAEYAAYAVNYIASLTSKNVSMIAWSQGNIDAQWAYKYWPSTRLVMSDHIAISPDYKGTTIADFADLSGLTNDPAVLQQEYFSNFITTLRANNGDSGYVPTTTVYSGFFDEIVEPQQGTGASAYLLDARNVGVSNSEAQTVCAGQVGGSFYTHEGMLYNPLSSALIKDALTNPGPGSVSRISSQLSSICSTYLAPGLELGDFLVTENAILIAGLSLLLYVPKLPAEPSISAYATASSTCATTTSASKPTTSKMATTTTTKKATTTTTKKATTTTTTKPSTTTTKKVSSTTTKASATTSKK